MIPFGPMIWLVIPVVLLFVAGVFVEAERKVAGRCIEALAFILLIGGWMLHLF